MVIDTLPETVPQSKALDTSQASIVIRLSLCGMAGIEIIADQSDEEETLRQRLAAAGPLLELLDRIFNVDQFTSQGIR